jgi:hypothetical protein
VVSAALAHPIHTGTSEILVSIDNFGMYGGRTLYGFSVQASCRRSASSESPFTRKLLPYILAAQVDAGATERAVFDMHMAVVRKSMW